MTQTIRTNIGNNTDIIEHFFCAEGNDYVSVYVEDTANKKRELIGTTFENISYTYNSKYVIFTSHEGIEIAFDIDSFDFITDEIDQMRAYSKLLKNSLIHKTNSEYDADYDLFVAKAKKRVIKNSKKALE